ncbi:MAG: molybdenum cofactor biosynthesis protein MoaE [Acidobacteria bacterium]|nr:molybdenum cofactor biosynthesis protein MoaE [Acidobacteriota bacterium]MYA45801.1 molybdenum cofactor biosynthesis protein MoaE [Acidobacteriota bacterium]MYB31097.1 molybdenum cofactor biosynthesis protein MoaE [Acidobacteriota bacterium]MYH23296.1 molybdenum cofactor biosynthesis protein MoaE [Acidobacteriota bacterium]MYI40169.1 molybdenum cofactor biosynthesis protein MoaE [Acidobacteriota bacterium]
MTERFRITSDPLDEQAVAEGLSTSEDGAVVVFSGIVRARNKGRKVLHLEYEAYEAMVYPVFERVAEGVSRRFGVERLRIHHRIGRVDIGESSVLVAAASPHRGTAFEAARHTMNEIKRIVPIWKREFFEGGDVWVEGPKEPVTE